MTKRGAAWNLTCYPFLETRITDNGLIMDFNEMPGHAVPMEWSLGLRCRYNLHRIESLDFTRKLVWQRHVYPPNPRSYCCFRRLHERNLDQFLPRGGSRPLCIFLSGGRGSFITLIPSKRCRSIGSVRSAVVQRHFQVATCGADFY
jgi:hypothetical protein